MTFGRIGVGGFVAGQAISVLLALTLAGRPAAASGTIGYGSRAGMEVTVISIEGLNTSRVIIRTRHTRENAIAFCREYVQSVTEKCIQKELSVLLNDQISANCSTGEFTDFYGSHYRFLGPNRNTGSLTMAKYAIIDLMTNKIADGTMASGYPTNIAIFRALCPARAPLDEFLTDIHDKSTEEQPQTAEIVRLGEGSYTPNYGDADLMRRYRDAAAQGNAIAQ